MVIPFFSDFGNHAKNLFHGGFPLNMVRFSNSIGTCNQGNVNISTAIAPANMTIPYGSLNFTYLAPPRYNTTITTGLDQDGTVNLEVSQNFNRWVNGLKWNGGAYLNTKDKELNFNSSTTYQHKWFSATGKFDDRKDNPGLSGSLTTAYKGFVLGGSLNSPLDNWETALSAGVGYCMRDAQMHLIWNKQEYDELKGYFYQRHGDRLETGIMVNWRHGNPPGEDRDSEGEKAPHGPLQPFSQTGNLISIAASYLLSPYTAVKGKLNTDSEATIALETRIRPGTTLTLCGKIDGKQINGGNHMIGLGFEVQA